MKKYNLLIISMMIFLITLSSVFAGTQYGVSLTNQDPDPAIAGELLELRFSITNTGTDFSNDLILGLDLAYPFESGSGQDYDKSVGTLTGYQVDEDAKVLKYTVKVDKDVVAGNYPLTARLYDKGNDNYVEKEFSIDIESKDSAEIIYIDTVELEPGKQTQVEFTINNVGSTPLRDMTFSWENADEAVLPVGSSNSCYIKYLDVGEDYKIVYDVIADSEADPGLYKLDLLLSYDNSLTGELGEISTNAGIYIGGGTNFEVAFSEVEMNEYSFTVANVGSNNANSVTIVVPEQQGWFFVGSNTELVGNLNKGDYTIAGFDLQKDNNQDSITVNVVYTDTKGVRKSIEKSVSLGSSATAMNNTEGNIKQMPTDSSRGGMREMSGGLGTIMTTMKWVGIGIVVLIIGIVGFKIYKKKKKFNKKK
jgi:hypothetical protein